MKKIIIILFVAGFLVAGFWFWGFVRKPKSEGPLCVEITETNRDTFKNELFMKESSFQRRKRLDSKDQKTKLFLAYHVVYEGVGRESSWDDTYVFDSFPAKIPLPGFGDASDKFQLALGDSIGRMLDIRLLSATELLINEVEQGTIKISVGEREVLVSAGEEQTLSKNSKTMAVTQEAFGPVPKGPITEKDIHVETVEYGNIEFSTELKIKNFGPCDLSPPSVFQRP